MTTSEYILNTYTNKIPIIIRTKDNSNFQLEKLKYIVPKDITIQQFHCILNKYIKNNKKQSIVLFVNNTLPINTESVGNLYNEHKDNDGFLYITLIKENTFG